MKNILVISQTNIIGGAEIVLKDYIVFNNDYNVFLYTNSEVVTYYYDYMETNMVFSNNTMNIFSLKKQPYKIFRYFNNLIKNLKKINKIVKTHNIDILYGNNSYDIILLALYKIFYNKDISVISHIHDMLDKYSLPGLYLKFFSGFLDQILVPSVAAKKSISRIVSNNSEIEVIYNGVIRADEKNINKSKLLEEFNLPKDKKIIAFIGKINKTKRPDIFVDILKGLIKYRSNFVGVIVGDVINDNLKRTILDNINNNNIPIIFLGKINYNEMHKIYSLIDILLLTSDKDSLPTVILEAMSYKNLVLARNVGGVEEIIDDEKDGFIFEYNSSIELISNKLNQILDLSKSQEKTIGFNALKKVENKFSNEAKVNKIRNIIQNNL